MSKKDEKIKNKKTRIIARKLTVFFIFFLFFSIFNTKSSVFSIFLQKKETPTTQKPKNPSFRGGEKLRYKISYGRQNRGGGILFAAYADLIVKDSIINNSTPVYSLSASGKTTTIFSLFMKVDHRYKTIVDAEKLHTIEHKMHVKEGRFFNAEHIFFNDDTALYSLKTNDILGAGYRLRTISPEELSSKDTVFFSYYYDGGVYYSYLLNLGEEVIDTKFGEINTIKFSPLLESGRMFKEGAVAHVWVSADKMHIPLKIELPILVGSVYVTLSSYENTLFDIKN